MRALVKLEQVLPSHLRRRVNALQTATVTLATSGGPTVDPEALTAIAGACRDRERLRFAYRGRDGAETSRIVEPHTLVNLGRRWYLVAWDCDRERLADLPRRPPRTPLPWPARASSRARCPTTTRRPSWRRTSRARRARYQARVTLFAPADGGGPSTRSSPDRPSRRSTSARASCARATTRWTGWPCAWPCSASTSRSTSRPSSSSACASWPRASSGRRAPRAGDSRAPLGPQPVAGGSCRRITRLRLRRLRLTAGCRRATARITVVAGRGTVGVRRSAASTPSRATMLLRRAPRACAPPERRADRGRASGWRANGCARPALRQPWSAPSARSCPGWPAMTWSASAFLLRPRGARTGGPLQLGRELPISGHGSRSTGRPPNAATSTPRLRSTLQTRSWTTRSPASA